MKKLLPIAILFGGMVSIQFGASLAKHLFPIIGPAGTTFLRQTFAAVILWTAFRPWKRGLKKRDLKMIGIYGLTLGFMNLTFYYSIERIPLGIAVAIEFVGPLGVALWGSRKPLDFLWAFLAVLGILLMSPVFGFSQPLDLVGAALAFAAGVFWGLYIISGKKAGGNIHGGTATAVGMAVAALVTSPFGVSDGTKAIAQPQVFAWALAVALFSGALPYTLEMAALKKLPSHTFSILMSLEPAIATLSGFLFLDEKISTVQGVAIMCVIVASLGSALATKQKSQPDMV